MEMTYATKLPKALPSVNICQSVRLFRLDSVIWASKLYLNRMI